MISKKLLLGVAPGKTAPTRGIRTFGDISNRVGDRNLVSTPRNTVTQKSLKQHYAASQQGMSEFMLVKLFLLPFTIEKLFICIVLIVKSFIYINLFNARPLLAMANKYSIIKLAALVKPDFFLI